MRRTDKNLKDSVLKDLWKAVKWLLGYTIFNIGFWGGLLVLFVLYIFTITAYGVPGEILMYDLERMFSDFRKMIVFTFKFVFWSIFIMILFPIVLIFMGLGASLK